jgi:hypothetical protein
MGYSCAAMASLVLDGIMDNVQRDGNSANVWQHNGDKYMWERGRENADGAITGTVYRFVNENEILPAGGFRIEQDGNITRFPGTSKMVKRESIRWAAAEYIRRFGFPNRHTIGENHPCRDILCNSPFVAV